MYIPENHFFFVADLVAISDAEAEEGEGAVAQISFDEKVARRMQLEGQ